jgi:hypothetical protein
VVGVTFDPAEKTIQFTLDGRPIGKSLVFLLPVS